MWNSGKHDVSEGQLPAEYWRVLEDAVSSTEEFPVEGEDVRVALDYFSKKVVRPGGLSLLCEGIEENRLDKMTQDLALLRKHIGR